MASLLSTRSGFAARPVVVARPRRSPQLCVKAFATDNGKQSLDDINRIIGQRIKEAAGNINTMRVWHYNASVGKYVKQAAVDAAAGKLKPRVAGRGK